VPVGGQGGREQGAGSITSVVQRDLNTLKVDQQLGNLWRHLALTLWHLSLAFRRGVQYLAPTGPMFLAELPKGGCGEERQAGNSAFATH